IPANDTDRVSYTQTVDVALAEIVALGFKNVGDTVYPTVKIVNTGTIPVYSPFDLILNVNGIDTLIETVSDSLDVGDTVTYLFTQGFIVPQITAMQPYYFLNIQTDMACDGVATNDKKQYLGDVNFKDLSIYDINNPTSTSYFKANDSVNVEVYIYNSGTFDSEGVKIYVEVDSAGVIIANFSETSEAIASKATVLHTFATKYRVPEFLDDTMSYDIRVYLEATEGDLDLTNDTMGTSTYALNDVNIDELGHVNWSMEQNIPNPASAATRIPYSIPQEGVIHFTLTTITGQVLHSQDIPSAAGSHSLEFDTQHLAGGIYYYSMEYQGQRIVKKMTIQK
ncbi:MAG: T9SS type A sorting domain-containing protein, partial [Bacteroidales bacterium]